MVWKETHSEFYVFYRPGTGEHPSADANDRADYFRDPAPGDLMSAAGEFRGNPDGGIDMARQGWHHEQKPLHAPTAQRRMRA